MMSGGALSRRTLFFSVTPYINASIIVQLLTAVIPCWSSEPGSEPYGHLAAADHPVRRGGIIGLVMKYWLPFRDPHTWAYRRYERARGNSPPWSSLGNVQRVGAQLITWCGGRSMTRHWQSLRFFDRFNWSSWHTTVAGLPTRAR